MDDPCQHGDGAVQRGVVKRRVPLVVAALEVRRRCVHECTTKLVDGSCVEGNRFYKCRRMHAWAYPPNLNVATSKDERRGDLGESPLRGEM